jgi:hypothetical protein
MLTTSFRDTLLGQLGGFVGLLTAITDWRAGTVTEASYTGYGTRPAVTWGAAATTSPAGGREKANSGSVSFPANTGSNQDCIGFGVYSASTAGTLQAIGLLDDDVPILGVAEAAGDTITAPAHGLATDQRVFVLACPGAVLPTGLAENTAYFVLASGLTTDVFKLSTTSGGAAVNITAAGASFFIPYKVVTVAGGSTPSFAAGTLVVQF